MKQTVVIFSDYTKISRKAERLFVKTHKTEGSIPLSNIDGILIFGKAVLTSDAISLCMSKRIPIILLTTFGKIKGLILPPVTSEAMNKRLKQVGLYIFKRLDIAKYIVKRKCLEIEYVFETDLMDIKLSIEKVNDYSHLLGFEGQASKIMFEKFSDILEETAFRFKERNYYPPKDEVNALLSFVYTLGYNLAIGLILLKGFDPFISFLHSKRGKHASFASDVMEIIRPKLTHFSAELLLQKKLTKDNFVKDDTKMVIKKPAVGIILEEFNHIKEDLIDLMKEFLMEFETFKY